MSHELKKESVKIGKKLNEVSAEQKLDIDIALPDYCTDIKKILRCTVEPGLHTVSVSGERVNAKGTATVRVVYLGEGDKADSFEKNIDLSCSAQLKEVSPDTVVSGVSVVDFVNCRASSQRKISVSASVTTIFSCFGVSDEYYAVKDESDNIQVKKEKLMCEEQWGYFEKTFDMAETVAINSEHPSVGKLICSSCRCVNESHKLSSGKLLIKGDVITDFCYLTENPAEKPYTFSHSMPISQIVDLKGVPDGASCNCNLRVSQKLYTVKSDSSGSNRLIDIALRITAFTEVYEKKECEVITDCYCTEYETEESYELPLLACPLKKVNEVLHAESKVSLPVTVKEICFAECTDITKSIKYVKDEAKADCSALVFIMYLDENGARGCCEKILDFSFSYKFANGCAEPYGDFIIDTVSLNAVLSGEDKAQLSLDYKVTGRVYCGFEKKILKALTLGESKSEAEKAPAITLYFAKKGEQLWNIAREHNTTVDIIMEENSLKEEILGEKTMLFISGR